MLIRFDPFRDFDRLTRQLWSGPVAAIPMDAYRSNDEVVASFDLPGVDPESIELTVDDHVLTVSAERRSGSDDCDEVLVAERPHGRATRRIQLGDSLDTDHVAAHYDDGVLTVRLPIAADAKPRRVAISAGERKEAIAAGTAA
ncbi:MAG: Hsp20/alpha crystallin family protein [Actinomycetota bacterium]|jgi:HSP20 family protein|nr:Hsp20/alpha crystallin family protein [Actinomycetota bacterium]